MIIFGGSGDLTSRKLMPALFNLFIDDYLPGEFAVLGIGRTDYGGDEKYREHLLKGIKEFSRRKDGDGDWQKFSEKVFYLCLDIKDESAFGIIGKWIGDVSNKWNEHPTVIYYMAVAPQLAPDIARKLSSQKLCSDPKKTRIVFEEVIVAEGCMRNHKRLHGRGIFFHEIGDARRGVDHDLVSKPFQPLAIERLVMREMLAERPMLVKQRHTGR